MQKDAAYWLPIFSLWQGCRVEEVGAAKAADIKQEDGHWFLDLRGRKLKNEQSQRMPFHPRIVGLGFIDYIERQLKGRLAFPGASTRRADGNAAPSKEAGIYAPVFKAWGRWCSANAASKGGVRSSAQSLPFLPPHVQAVDPGSGRV